MCNTQPVVAVQIKYTKPIFQTQQNPSSGFMLVEGFCCVHKRTYTSSLSTFTLILFPICFFICVLFTTCVCSLVNAKYSDTDAQICIGIHHMLLLASIHGATLLDFGYFVYFRKSTSIKTASFRILANEILRHQSERTVQFLSTKFFT